MAFPSFLGLVRRFARPSYTDGSSQTGMNNGGDLLVSQGLPPKTELVRLANSWTCQIATGSAFIPVAAMPTTRAELAFYNGYADNTCMVIDSIWAFSLTSLAAASGLTVIYQVAQAAALTNDTAQLINSPVGKAYSGAVTRAVAVTTLTANKWAAVGASGGISTTTTIGAGHYAPVDGGIVVKPGFTLGVNVVFSTAAGTALMGVAWHEVRLDTN